jgi:glycosyltransferase involved in cell wall biosynthesis
MRVYVDHTHLWRHVTGIERITLQLFSTEALAPLDAVPVRANGMASMLTTQALGMPARLLRTPSALLLCPGFPPSPLLQPFAGRVIPYIHDVFLLSRRVDLNWRAKAYMAWPFEIAVRRLPRFLVNSADTAAKLRAYCRDDAEITVYRPAVRNNFRLSVGARAARPREPGALRLVALGTVEPRKNLTAAGRIVGALREQGFPGATLDVIGRRGWGNDWDALSQMPGVVLHGYQPDEQVTAILDRADALISTSHEEGLGLPLLEAQYGGLAIIAPDQPVFREVLDGAGIFIDPADPRAAASTIKGAFTSADWRAAFVARAAANLTRWNNTAAADRNRVLDMLIALAGPGKEQADRLLVEN